MALANPDAEAQKDSAGKDGVVAMWNYKPGLRLQSVAMREVKCLYM